MLSFCLTGGVFLYTIKYIEKREGTLWYMKKEKIPRHQYIVLLGLTIAAFIFNTSEFMPIALLSDIAEDFAMSTAGVGIMITAYAWVVAILSLPLMLLASSMEFRKLLLATIGLFCIGQIVAAAAINFYMLLVARICVACAHSIFWSIAAPIAVQLVSKEHRSMALSMVATGTSVAMIVGLPLGRVIGLAIGWRMTFACIAITAFATMVYLFFVFPEMTNDSSFSVHELPTLLKNRVLKSIYVVTVLTATAYYTGYSYIEPFLSRVALLSDTWVTMILTIFGVAGFVGSCLFTIFYDHYRYQFIRGSFIAITIPLWALHIGAGSVYIILGLCVLWGIASMAFNITLQAEVMQCVPVKASAVAMSMYSGIFNIGIGTGTWFGGMVMTYSRIDYIGYAGGMLAMIATTYCMAKAIREIKNKEALRM